MSALLASALRPRAIAAALAVGCVAVLAWRMHLEQSPGSISDRTYYASDTRIDSIIYGAILALIANPSPQTISAARHVAVRVGGRCPAAVALLLTLVYRNPTFRETFRYSIQGLALMPLFYFAIRFSDNALFRKLNLPWMMSSVPILRDLFDPLCRDQDDGTEFPFLTGRFFHRIPNRAFDRDRLRRRRRSLYRAVFQATQTQIRSERCNKNRRFFAAFEVARTAVCRDTAGTIVTALAYEGISRAALT